MSFPNISCDTFGIDRPSILWSIDHECRLVPPDEGLIEPLTSIQLVPILDTWHNDTTVVRLTFNGSATLSANGTLRCMHKLATTGEYICSEAFKCKYRAECYIIVYERFNSLCSKISHLIIFNYAYIPLSL